MSEKLRWMSSKDDDAILEGEGTMPIWRGDQGTERTRRHSGKSGAPHCGDWSMRRQKRTAELTSDFEDYDLDEPVRAGARNARR